MLDPLMVTVIKNFFGKVFSFAKKAAIVIVVYIIIISLFIGFNQRGNQKKQITIDSNETNRITLYKIVQEGDKSENISQNIATAFLRALTCRGIGELCSDNPKEAEEFKDQSISGFFSNLISAPYANPPASGVYWVYSGLSSAGFIPKTYAAQGIGFTALNPYKQMWTVFRNFTYLLMVIILVAIGFMIMFRTKLNPQTVISVENALPKIVIAMILVTFSYAICGFLIDIMYISIGLITALFNQIDPIYDGVLKMDRYNALDDFILRREPWVLILGDPFTISTALLKFVPAVVRGLLDGICVALFFQIITKIVFWIWKIEVTPGAGIAAVQGISKLSSKIGFLNKMGKWINSLAKIKDSSGKLNESSPFGIGVLFSIIIIVIEFVLQTFTRPWASAVILALVIFFSMIFMYFRILFMLISTYINTLLLILFSPIIIALEAVPGKSVFSAWFKNVFINLLTFPILIAIVLLSRFFYNFNTDQGSLWRPPFLYAFDNWSFQMIISGALIFMAPDLINTFKKMLGFKPLGLDLNLGVFFGGGQAVLGGGMGMLGQFSSLNLGLSAFGLSSAGKKGGIFNFLLGRSGTEVKENTEGDKK